MSTSSSTSKSDAKALERLDRSIVLATQAGLPICEQPFEAVAREINSTASLVKARFKLMLDDGRIRRIGLVPNHYRLGYVANGMSVWDVEDKHIELAGEMVGALTMVSHCYQRPRALPEWPYNLFAMVHGRYRDEVMDKIEQIRELLSDNVRSHDVLFSTRILKKTGLRIS